ncbi:formimidoylglutamate deiminase [Kiloniella antarctica]|uniref:Formimidoylglutamate deiminase n=1 Tax=Kiloniella antarctica TaxID=1550907 RepID=A0ABW5BN97_9PROT
MTKGFHLKRVFTGHEWLENISIHIDPTGHIVQMIEDNNPDRFRVIKGPVVPGMTNLHCHSFQFAMAGLTEVRRNPVDTFWSWREMMYYFALRLSPEDQTAVAAKFYLECLKHGYTSLVEFHYIHNAQDGSCYASPEEMSLAILAAAQKTGIQLTHLPVFYAHSDFGGQPPHDGQRRFVTSLDTFSKMLGNLKDPCASQGVNLGIAPHSLRAVSESEMSELVQLLKTMPSNAPMHIHVAEQMPEVKAAQEYSNKRPIEMLFDLADVDARWCLIHATHMTSSETKMVAQSGATVGLCPVTEANLGDGVFNGVEYIEQGGCFGIGSDSNVNCDPFAELQMFEYSQRLIHQKRTVLASSKMPNTGTNLFSKAAMGGGRAAGRKSGVVSVGYLADFFELVEENGTMFDTLPTNSLLDYRMFSQSPRIVGDVISGGKLVVDAGRHPMEERINSEFQKSMKALCQEI